MKKEKSIKQKKNKERALQYTLFASEFVAIPTPFAIMAIVKSEEWFVQNPEGWKIGLGGSIAIALMSIAVLLVGAKKENKEITGGYIAIVLGWYAFAFVAMLLADILQQIYYIMMIGGSGMLAAFGLDQASKAYKKKADMHQSAMTEAEKEINKEQAKEEIIESKKRF